jgi:5-methyltetrahydropteroyltriglutamate--homocysteine methyltransferase
MPLVITTIGAYPKPEYVELPDWFTVAEGPGTARPTAPWAYAMAAMADDAEALRPRGTHKVVREQVDAGIDIPTDGELRRENYNHYRCRHLAGFDFEAVREKVLCNGAYNAFLPTVRGPVTAREPFLVREWRIAQAAIDKPVKITIPGPMTVTDTVVDTFYSDPARMGANVVAALNVEVRALAESGCRHTQIDEPLFARKPDSALACGLDNLERAFHGAPDSVTRTLHMCCGYPDKLDWTDYPKADTNAYVQIADSVDASSVDAVSLEDTHRHNDLSLLEHFVTTTVIFGLLAIAKSRVETVDELVVRLRAVLNHIDAERVMAAPDCSLTFFGKSLAVQKMRVLCQAAKAI